MIKYNSLTTLAQASVMIDCEIFACLTESSSRVFLKKNLFLSDGCSENEI